VNKFCNIIKYHRKIKHYNKISTEFFIFSSNIITLQLFFASVSPFYLGLRFDSIMLSKDNIINSKTGKQYDTRYHGNSVSETETAGYMQFEGRRGGERRGRKKSRDDS
jgi:hypothetical protein